MKTGAHFVAIAGFAISTYMGVQGALISDVHCNLIDLEVMLIADSSSVLRETVPADFATQLALEVGSWGAALSNVKVGSASFGHHSMVNNDSPSCFQLHQPLTNISAGLVKGLEPAARDSSATSAHLEAVANALVDSRVGWTLRPTDETRKLVKAVVLLTDSVASPGGDFNLNALRQNSEEHCRSKQYPEAADLSAILKRGDTSLVVGLLTPTANVEQEWRSLLKDVEQDLTSTQASLMSVHSKSDLTKLLSEALVHLSSCTTVTMTGLSADVPSQLTRECEADCDCTLSADCACCSGFKVLLRLPTEPKDIEIKVTH